VGWQTSGGRKSHQRSAAHALRAPDRVIHGAAMAMKRIGIVVGGGPAPGTNAAIAAAVIEAVKLGCTPIGFHDGFHFLAQRYTDEQHEMTIEEVSRAHLAGGVILGASRTDVGADTALLRNAEDARTSGRWYLGVTMGRPTGHLTLGIGKAVSATCTIIPEEFGAGYARLADVADIVEGSIIKRRAMGKAYGVAILSEALVERFDPKEVAELEDVDRDAQGNIRVNEVDLGRNVIHEVTLRLARSGIKVSVVDKTIGYELR